MKPDKTVDTNGQRGEQQTASAINNGQYIQPIASIRTPFTDKFVTPRQSGLIQSAIGIVSFYPAFCDSQHFPDFAAHSHYWLIWGFHLHENKKPNVTVRPPRLGGNTKKGVFATRSSFRPNLLGLSVVKLHRIDNTAQQLHFSGVDMVDQTPIYDIKPYIPYADCLTQATSTWANHPPKATFDVQFSDQATQQLNQYESNRTISADSNNDTNLFELINELLQYDPRPAYHNEQKQQTNRIYACRLYDLDIQWQVNDSIVTVLDAKLFNHNTEK